MKRNNNLRGITKFFLIVLFLVFTIVIIVSCATEKVMIKPRNSSLKSISDSNISLNIEYLSKTELVKKFGDKNNPFISPVSFLRSNRLMVFKLNITNKNYPVLLMSLNKIELQFGSVNVNPYNRFQLANFWEPRLKKRQSEYKRWNMSVLKNIINKNVFDNNVKMKKGRSSKGYIIFKGPFPDYGKAVIYIPFFDSYGKMLKRYEIEFEF